MSKISEFRGECAGVKIFVDLYDDRAKIAIISDDGRQEIRLPTKAVCKVAELVSAAAMVHTLSERWEGPKRQKSPSFRAIRANHPRAYALWTDEEDELVAQLIQEGVPVSEVAKFTQRQPSAIRSRIQNRSEANRADESAVQQS